MDRKEPLVILRFNTIRCLWFYGLKDIQKENILAWQQMSQIIMDREFIAVFR